MPAASTGTIIIGHTNRKVFWSVVLAGIFLMITMVFALSSQLIALAAVALPFDFTITADRIEATNFNLVPGPSHNNPNIPVAILTTMDAKITNQVITRSFSLLGHTISVKITAGDQGTPVTVKGLLTVDTTGVDAGSAQFTNLVLSTGPAGDTFTQSADSQVLTNAIIEAPYLMAQSITLPNLSVSLSLG
jgi:uncharacterized protein DUF6230